MPPTPSYPSGQDARAIDLLDEVASFIAAAAPHPNHDIAMAGAIALLSGICGRCYNTFTGAGLNQYLLMLASTGMGKEAAASGISKLLRAVATDSGVPAAIEFKGPALVSAPGLIKWLDKRSSVVSVAGEFGYKLKAFASARVNPNDELLKATLLDLYGKSGAGSVFDPLAYSEREKQTGSIVSPSLTLLGESVPSVVYEALGESMVLSGLLPRFTVLEITGERSPLNENPASEPTSELRQRLADLCAYSLQLNSGNRTLTVQPDDEGGKLLRKFGQWVTDEINAHNSEVTKELWNRAHLKALKLATLRAVARNHLAPLVNYADALWATNLIAAQTHALIGKFESGETGPEAGNPAKQERALCEVIEYYCNQPWQNVKGWDGREAYHRDGVITQSHIQQRLYRRATFAKDPRGAKDAIQRVIKTLLEADIIREINRKQMTEKYGRQPRAFGVSDPDEVMKRAKGGF